MRSAHYAVWFRTRVLLCSLLLTAAGVVQADEPALQLFTEVFPPYSMAIDGSDQAHSAAEITGSATEIIKELMSRAGVDYTLELVPWKRAYDKALHNVNHGVFSTTRTEEREARFQWVGPIAENNWVFMGRADSPIELERLEQAGAYRIGGYLEDAIADYLVAQGLQVEYVANDALNVRKLAKSRIDLWPVVQLKGVSLARAEGVEVKQIYTIKRTVLALALNLETDPLLVAKLNRTLSQMHDDGTVNAIAARFEAIDAP